MNNTLITNHNNMNTINTILKRGLVALLAIFVSVGTVHAQEIMTHSHGIFFSEYIEGGGNNKAFEIFNSTDDDIDLGNYIVLGNYNGNPFNDTLRFSVGTMLASMDVFVVAHEGANSEITAVADSLMQNPYDGGSSYIAVFNGDDARALVHIDGTDSTIVDYFGTSDNDPGSGWDVAGISAGTKDHTLVRKSSIQSGNPVPLASFGSDSSSSEWVVYDKDDFSHIGSHTHGSDSSGVPNSSDFYLHENGITIICNEASIGDKGIVAGTEYTKRSADQITVDNASTTCTSGIIDMSELFYGFGIKLPTEIGHWDVSSVTDMSYMFHGDTSQNFFETQANLNYWDVSSVTNMSYMFWHVFNIPLISDWDVSNVVDMSGMFGTSDLAYETIGSDITNWDISNVTDMSRMFAHRLKFNQNISGWDVSRVTNMESLFEYNEIFNQDISGWDVDSVTNMSGMFKYADIFNQDISGWNVSGVTNMGGMFANTTDFNQNIGGWDVSSVNKMAGMFSNAAAFNQDLSSWNVSNVFSWEMDEMFDGALQFNQDLSGWCVSQFESAPSRFGNSGNDPVWGTCLSKIIRIAPQNSQYDVGFKPTFIWRSDSTYNYYRLELSNGLGDTLIYNDTSYTVPYPLELNSTYSWRVRGYKQTYDQQNGYTNVYGPWNEFWSFQTRGLGDTLSNNIIRNGDFAYKDSSWTFSGSEQIGVISADNHRLDFQLKKNNSNNNIYDLFARQYFTSDQIASLEEGGQWELSFKASATSRDRLIHVFLGEIGGGWDRYWSSSSDSTGTGDILIKSGSLKGITYSLTTEVTKTWANMALSFEVANDTVDLWIDDVVLKKFDSSMRLHENGVTIICDDVPNGYSQDFNGITYTKRRLDEITPSNASTTCTSEITDFSWLFMDNTAFNEDISHWDVSSAKWMHAMFRNAKSFNKSISDWDVSKLNVIASMFNDAEKFNQPIGNWNVSNVTNMSFIFKNATAFNQPINTEVVNKGKENEYIAWNVSNLQSENAIYVFKDAKNFSNNNAKWYPIQ